MLNISRFNFKFVEFTYIFRGLVPDCLAILKTCHALTEKLVGMTMGNAARLHNQGMITELVTVAKKISPKVDAVVRAMYPPLDPRLLEARFVFCFLCISCRFGALFNNVCCTAYSRFFNS